MMFTNCKDTGEKGLINAWIAITLCFLQHTQKAITYLTR